MLASELIHTIEHLQSAIEDLTIRGLRSAGDEQISRLEAIKEEFDRIGASHLSSRVAAVVDGVKSGDRKAAAALMRAQASLRLFERVLTLEQAQQTIAMLVACDQAAGGIQAANGDECDAFDEDCDEMDDDDDG